MIVVDTNILVYLHLPTKFTSAAETLLTMQQQWCAPLLWRSEFRNVLALYLRKELITLDAAVQTQQQAELLLTGNEYQVPSIDVLELVNSSDCSAYDCEYVALAKQLNIDLYTQDKKVLKAFPDIAKALV